MAKLLLLDMDGTVRQPKSSSPFITDPYDQKIIVGVKEALDNFKDWIKIGVSNQGGVAANHKSLKSTILEQMVTLELLLELQTIYFCPDYSGDKCYRIDRGQIEHAVLENHVSESDFEIIEPRYSGHYRKPRAGMLLQAFSDFNDLEETFDKTLMVGDRTEDAEAALRANIPFMPANEWIRMRSSINS